jgi:hypothetical protein
MNVENWFHPDKSVGSKWQLHMYYVTGLIQKPPPAFKVAHLAAGGCLLLFYFFLLLLCPLTPFCMNRRDHEYTSDSVGEDG